MSLHPEVESYLASLKPTTYSNQRFDETAHLAYIIAQLQRPEYLGRAWELANAYIVLHTPDSYPQPAVDSARALISSLCK